MGSILTSPAVTCDCLPQFEILDCLGRTPLTEVWKARDPGGKSCAVKYIYEVAQHDGLNSQFVNATSRLQQIRHAALASVLSVASDAGRLVLVTELAEHTLRDRYEECLRQGLPGIPREELIGYLRSAAEALDYLQQKHGIQHLSLNPSTLLLKDRQLLVADFGLVQLLWIPLGHSLSQVNARYAPPECFKGQVSPQSDQYSLALVFQEMLTGMPAFHGQSPRQLAESRLSGAPRLESLNPPDRPIVLRALERLPKDRYPNCTAFVDALRDAGKPAAAPAIVTPRPLVFVTDQARPKPPLRNVSELSTTQQIQTLVQSAADSLQVREYHGLRFKVTPEGEFQHRCAAWLPERVARHKIAGFLERWRGRVIESDAERVKFHIDLAKNMWQRVFVHKRYILEVDLQLHAVSPDSKLTQVRVSMRFVRGNRASQLLLLEQVGPGLMEDLHTFLLATPERRVQERFEFQRRLCISPMGFGDEASAPVEGFGKDISETGIGFYTTCRVPFELVYIYHASSPDLAPFVIPAAVTRIKQLEDGRYEAGARFVVEGYR